MTTERQIAIAAPLDRERKQLLADIRSAAGRVQHADPGDRLDIVRHEALSSQLELWAFEQRLRPPSLAFNIPPGEPVDPAIVDALPLPGWIPAPESSSIESIVGNNGVLVAVCLPLECGARTATSPRKIKARPPSKPWQAKDDNGVSLLGSRAVEKRFQEQLEAAVNAKTPEPIYPTGIQNRVLSDTLRDFVHQVTGAKRIDVPIEYRDGSRAQSPFPLRSLKLIPIPEEPHDIELRMALLSIRHTEMDALVDGAWLRNAQISQPRTQAETDDLVYGISLEQLEALTDRGNRRLKLEISKPD